MGPKFEDMWVAVIEQGRTAEAAIDGVNETIDSMTSATVIIVAGWFLGEEMAVEQ
jgi:hypothetical protein